MPPWSSSSGGIKSGEAVVVTTLGAGTGRDDNGDSMSNFGIGERRMQPFAIDRMEKRYIHGLATMTTVVMDAWDLMDISIQFASPYRIITPGKLFRKVKWKWSL